MSDALEQVLRLVAEGRLTADQAAPILDALAEADDDATSGPDPDRSEAADDPTGPPRRSATSIRIEISEGGRKVVNLRVPVSLGRMAMDRIPGLSGTNADMVRQALAEGRSGTLLDIDDDGSGVRIALE
jgi:hypothetical protein